MAIVDFINSINKKDYKKEVQEIIMGWFRKTNSRAGDVLPQRSLNFDIKLNPKQQDEFINAVEDLINQGLIEFAENKGLRLTKQGVDFIY